ncbi:MAG: type II toxin-antitoxin system RelE/ParE family toxin [Dehalococcoidia bacterium]
MNIIWTEEAIDSFEAAFEGLAARFPRSAAEFADKVTDGIQRLSEFPESAPMVPEFENPRFRQFRVGAYRMLYRISADGITIEAFLHWSVRLDTGE